MNESIPKLCYIYGDTAYFTTKELNEQYGDDWDDAPYEHNAGTPYEPGDDESFIIFKIKFDTGLQTPAEKAGFNSNYSVDEINTGKVAWLSSPSWMTKKINIFAGCSIAEFKKKIWESGGKIYIEEELRKG